MAFIDPQQGVGKAAGNIFNRTIGRLFGAGLNKGAESPLATSGQARWAVRNNQTDWRVKLTIPQDSDLRTTFFGSNNSLMESLREHGGVVFPLTPSVIVQHIASYNPLATTHSNYPFYAYGHSESSSLTIVGEFPVQNYEDAQAWVATLHFFRTVTKMFFGGDTATRGNPPPVLKLNGYGEYVLKNVPVVVTNFSVELTQGVDYISTSQNTTTNSLAYDFDTVSSSQKISAADDNVPDSWAPTSSLFTVQVQPVYSRESIKNFSLQKFVNGDLNNLGGNGNKEGIGFI